MDRRQFIKVTAATTATATLAGCGNPELHIARFIPEEELIPGIAVWKPSICPLCSAGCGMNVRIMEGEAEVVRNGQTGLLKMGLAKKLEGNPLHPVSQGKLCARGQASIQITYHPDRITQPMKRSGERGFGQYKPIPWADALGEFKTQLDTLAAAGDQKSLAFLSKPLRGQRQALIAQFLTGYGSPSAIEFEFFGEAVLRQANLRSFGYEQLPTINLAQSKYAIAFGADFLGTWNSPVSQSVGYGDMRQGNPGQRGKFVQVEPRMSQTGANADEWVPTKPGTEGVLALGLAHVIIASGLKPATAAGRAGAAVEGFAGGLTAYTPEKVEAITGVKKERIERLAHEFGTHGPAVALIGGAPLAMSNGMFHALAVNALNALVGSVGQPGGLNFTPRTSFAAALTSPGRIDKFAADILGGQSVPKVLLLNDANPVFGTPSKWKVKEALAKIPYIVSFGSFLDETSMLADLILPDHSFLESWVDHTAEAGASVAVASVAPPAMRPLHQTRAMPDVLLEIGRTLAKPIPNLKQTYEEFLQAAYSALPVPKAKAVDDPPVDVWADAQAKGGWWGEVAAKPAASVGAGAKAVAYTEPQFDGAATDFPYHFLPYASSALFDGTVAHLPWLQEMPDPLTTAMWSSWIDINPQTALKLGIEQGDMVEVVSAHGTLRSPAVISPGIAPDVIGMPVGQCHISFTRFASGRGANPIAILAPVTEPETGSLAWASTRVKIQKVAGAGGLILFSKLAEAANEHDHDHDHR